MKKRLSGLLLLAALSGGCVNSGQPGTFMSHVGPGGGPACGPAGCTHGGGAYQAKPMPNVVGAYGESVPTPVAGTLTNPRMPIMGQRAVGNASEAQMMARESFMRQLPPEAVSQVLVPDDKKKNIPFLQSGIPLPNNGLMQAGGPMPPSSIMQVAGPGPGGAPAPMPGAAGPLTVLPPGVSPPPASPLPGVVAAVGALRDGQLPYAVSRTSVRFAGPNGMRVAWYIAGADGKPELTQTSIEVPGRYNFPQAAINRLKLTNIPGRPGVELYPTLEVVPSNNRTATFLQHSSVPLVFTQEDFDQVLAGNFLVKVVYLPNPQFQDLAINGPNEIVSSRLEPGADPIAEALQRGSILLIVRMGNIDLEAPNTPPLDAPSAYAPKAPPGGPGLGAPPQPFCPPLLGPGGPGGMMPPPPGLGGMGGPGGPGFPPGPDGGAPMMPPPGFLPGMPMGMMPPGMGMKSMNGAVQPVGFEEPAEKKGFSLFKFGKKDK